MSGHAGLQVIANRPQPINGGMQVGGKWVGSVDETTLPVAMYVDWVKFYELSIDGKRISKFSRTAQ